MNRKKLIYRPEIDGLRAIAVVSVLLFHLNKSWLPGGFIGVDIFFVISGFLITKLLVSELETGTLSIPRFYQRRIARLAPMMIVVVAATVAAAFFVYSSQDFASAGVNAVAALLSVANIKFLLQGDYFQISPDAQPFLHFWSLSVEEQYYLIFPFLLILLYKSRREWVGGAIVAITVISFALCVALTLHNPVVAFYLLPTRAWELGCGAILAIYGQRLAASIPTSIHRSLVLLGIFVISAAFVTLNEETLFPGYAALLPVFGAAMIILATERHGFFGQSVLGSSPFLAIGKTSYGLYLWHWPVFSLTDYALYDQSDLSRLLVKVFVTAALTSLTYFYLEKPSRRLLNRRNAHWPVIVAFVTIAVVSVPVGLGIRNSFYVDAKPSVMVEGGLRFSGAENAPQVMLIGDSQGSMYGRLVRDVAAELDWPLVVASSAAGDSLPRSSGASSRLWNDTLALVVRDNPDILIMGNYWSRKLEEDPERLRIALDALVPHVSRIIVIDQSPLLPTTVNRSAIRDGLRGPFHETEAQLNARLAINTYMREVSADQMKNSEIGIRFIDVASVLLNEDNSIPFVDDLGRQVFQDSQHLSHSGARLLEASLRSALLSLD